MSEIVIFDLDGTLVNTAPQIIDILKRMGEDRKLPKFNDDNIRKSLSVGGEAVIKAAFGSLVDMKKTLADFREIYASQETPKTALYDGVYQTLKQLSEDGKKMRICTNKPRRLAIKALKELELYDSFEFIVAGDDLPTKKPSPQSLMACIGTDLAKNSLLYVGDSEIDHQTAAKCNIPFCLFQNGENSGELDQTNYVFKFDRYTKFRDEYENWLNGCELIDLIQ
jgi:phosphoglycolate phosphatase